MPIQNRVSEKYTVKLGAESGNKDGCGELIESFTATPTGYRVVDGRTLIPTPSSVGSVDFIPLRAWRFPGPIDQLTMFISFGEIVALTGLNYPTLHFKILVGMGGTTDHVVTGSYTPANKTQATDKDEMGMLVQYCGRIFDTIELHVRAADPAAPTIRKFGFSLGMYAIIAQGHCESRAQTGLNGLITFVAPTYQSIVGV